MTLNDLERPKRTLVQKRCVFWRPLTLVSGNIRYMRILVLLAGTSNESGVVNDGNFGDFSSYFFGHVRDKASNVI